MICKYCGEPTDKRVPHKCPDPIEITFVSEEIVDGKKIVQGLFKSGISCTFELKEKP